MRDPSGENAGSVAFAVSVEILVSCARFDRSAAYSWNLPPRELASTISPTTYTSAVVVLPPGAVALIRAWPYPVPATVPSSPTVATCGLSVLQVRL